MPAVDNKVIIGRINNLEAAAKLILEECHRTKELLGGFYPSTARKGLSVEEKANIKLKRRKNLARSVKNL